MFRMWNKIENNFTVAFICYCTTRQIIPAQHNMIAYNTRLAEYIRFHPLHYIEDTGVIDAVWIPGNWMRVCRCGLL